MENIDVFVQVQGDTRTEIITLPEGETVDALVRAVAQKSLPVPADGGLVFVEEDEEPVAGNLTLEAAKIKHKSRVHIHRCKRIEVTVHFKDKTEKRDFAPSATVKRVLKWALDEFIKHGADQADHALQLCESEDRPNVDIQIGALVKDSHCQLCFDLVPTHRVEG